MHTQDMDGLDSRKSSAQSNGMDIDIASRRVQHQRKMAGSERDLTRAGPDRINARSNPSSSSKLQQPQPSTHRNASSVSSSNGNQTPRGPKPPNHQTSNGQQHQHPPSSGSAQAQMQRRYPRPPAGGDFDRRMPPPSKTSRGGNNSGLETADESAPENSRDSGSRSGRLFNPASSSSANSYPTARRRHAGSTSTGHSTGNASTSGQKTSIPHLNSSSASSKDRQLFDPRLHDPVRFLVQRPSPPSLSSSATNSTHPPSTSSGTVSTALSSIHEGDRERERRRRREGSEKKSSRAGDHERSDTKSRSSEGSESLKDRQRGKGGDTGVLGSLREQYKVIQTLESSLIDTHRKMSSEEGSNESITDEGWVGLYGRHMKLAHAHHDFLLAALDPRLPASLYSLPVKYNIPTRLWQNGFHLLLERMRITWLAPKSSTYRDSGPDVDAAALSETSARALEHLTDYILDAYSFYTALLDEQILVSFRSAWIEALGDLARYKMAVANHVALSSSNNSAVPSFDAVPANAGRIDDDEEDHVVPPSGNSIGKEVADSWDIEDRETWRTTARDWYAMGVAEKPGEGRLHHRLALISRDVKGEEERALYHFSKSLITNYPFVQSRESILPLFDTALQKTRAQPDATASDLFVLLHGMLFTRIQLDDFEDVFARFMERLEEDRLGTRPLAHVEWLLMSVVNLSSCLQYGAEDGLIRKASAEDAGRKSGAKGQHNVPQAIMVHSSSKKEVENGIGDDEVDIEAERLADLAVGSDGSDLGSTEQTVSGQTTLSGHNNGDGEVLALFKKAPEDDAESLPLAFRHSLKLAFSVLEFCLNHPIRKDRFGASIVNPYITVFLTWFSAIFKHPQALSLVERYVPWTALISFLNTIPRKIDVRADTSVKLTGGGPLPEDWCLRGMEWVGRKVYERGFWKQKSSSHPDRSGGRSTETIQSEMDVISFDVEVPDMEQQMRDGIVEGEDDGTNTVDVTIRRWKRISFFISTLVKHVPGVIMQSDGRKLQVDDQGALRRKIDSWEAERLKLLEEELFRKRREEELRGDWIEDEVTMEEQDVSEDDEDEDPELRALKAQRRKLRAILSSSVQPLNPNLTLPSKHLTRQAKPQQQDISVLAGYTVLVFDTNVLLGSLETFGAVVEGGRWTVVIPLPVITELDGLSTNPEPLGPTAMKALTYLTTHIRSHSRTLKVQTSRGNYLSDLNIRAEDISFTSSDASHPEKAKDLDDLILRACVFQQDHFVDRTSILGVNTDVSPAEKDAKAKVVLLTFDRNLRVRAISRGVSASHEKVMAKILAG